jgi:biopolymer transport protein ExbD
MMFSRSPRFLSRKSLFLFLAPSLSLFFCLLFFLILGGHFLLQPGIAVKVPTSPFLLIGQESPYVVSITASPAPELYFQDQPVTLTQLHERLKHLQGPRNLIIKGDKGTPYQLLVEVITLGEEEGFSTILATNLS